MYSKCVIFVCLYIDDMFIVSNDMTGITKTKRFLSSTFKIKDFEQIDTILGIKAMQNSGDFTMTRSHY